MHNPGICGAILAIGPPGSTAPAQAQTTGSPTADSAANLGQWIDALNADTDMVLVAMAEDDEALARAVWARAAYLVPLPSGASVAEALRALLQETLNRGRDAALVTSLQTPPVSGETVRRMVEAYRAAGDEVWALLPEGFSFQPKSTAPESSPGCYPMLLGRRMIELFLRTQNWSSAEEVLLGHREHVRALNSSDPAGIAGTAFVKQEP